MLLLVWSAGSLWFEHRSIHLTLETIGVVLAFVLAFIALVLWASAARKRARSQSALDGVLVREAALHEFRVLSPTDELSDGVRWVLRGCQQDFPVLRDGQLVGMLTRHDMMAMLAADAADSSVNHSMRRDFPTADASEPLQIVVERMQRSAYDTLPVLDNGRLVALLTLENVAKFMLNASALRPAIDKGHDWGKTAAQIVRNLSA